MADLKKQVWINQVMHGFYPDSSFLKYVKDFSALVDNDKINLAEAGVDPVVLINNTTYPIVVKQRSDIALDIELDKFETENTLVRRPEILEYAFDQMESVIMGHRSALRARTAEKAAHAYAPKADSLYTPVIKTTGEAFGGRKRLQYADIIELKSRFDQVDIPLENRFLVLSPQHVTDLLKEDIKLFKDLTNPTSGSLFDFAGFKMLQFSKTPKYEIVDGELSKMPFSTTESSSYFSSFAFHGEEVMKADGSMYMYALKDDPRERGTIIGFDKRFIAVPLRNKGIGAIVSDVSE